MFPFVDKEGGLFFSSDGHPGLGDLDIFYVKTDLKTLKASGPVRNAGAPINSSRDETALVTARLRTAINERNEADRRGYDIRFSVGQVELPPGGDADIALLLAQGDAEMYKNKQAMRNKP